MSECKATVSSSIENFMAKTVLDLKSSTRSTNQKVDPVLIAGEQEAWMSRWGGTY